MGKVTQESIQAGERDGGTLRGSASTYEGNGTETLVGIRISWEAGTKCRFPAHPRGAGSVDLQQGDSGDLDSGVPSTQFKKHCLVLGFPGEESTSFEDLHTLAPTHILRAGGREGVEGRDGGEAGGTPVLCLTAGSTGYTFVDLNLGRVVFAKAKEGVW